MAVETDAVRFLAAASVLAFAAVTDLRWRRAPDLCWLLLALVGGVLLLVDARQTPDFLALNTPFLVVAGLLFVVGGVGYYTGLFSGGADAKALMALAVLFPLPLDAAWTLPLSSPFPAVLTVLMNALLVALAVPVGLGLYNLVRGDLQGLHTFLGLPVPHQRVDPRVVWPLEYYDEEGTHVRRLSPRRVPLDAFDPADFAARDIERVWVTPKVPFLVPLWIGVLLVMLAGDPVAWLLRVFLG